MKAIKLTLSMLIAVVLVSSCGMSGNGFSGSSIQKRKYTSGFYLNGKGSLKGLKGSADSKEDKEAENRKSELKHAEVDSKEETTGKVETPIIKTQQEEVVVNQEVATVETSNETNTPVVSPKEDNNVAKTVSKEDAKAVTKKPMNQIQAVKKVLNAKKAATVDTSDPLILILLVILALILPPLAVFLVDGASNRFIIDLILWIIGWGIGFWLIPHLAWLCSIIAVVYALLIVLGVI